MKRKVLKSLYFFTFLFSVIAVSCKDDFPYSDVTIPEGEGTLSATITFTPNKAATLGETRTDGDALNDINSLCVLVYEYDNKDNEWRLKKRYTQNEKENQKELADYSVDDYKVNQDNDKYPLDQNFGEHIDEKTTKQASFVIPDLPFGKYHIFAVANMGDMEGYDVSTIEKLQNVRLEWKPDKIELNNQMFGYFTSEHDAESEGFISERPLTFNGTVKNSKIHAWLKRAASKVTVAFDPSGLNQGVTIYVRSVTVMDIPKTCLLGAENTPTSVDELYNHLDSYNNPDYTQPEEFDLKANSRLEYNAEGVIDGGQTGSAKTDGLKLDNSIHSAIPANAHAVDAPSLFFYENNQNPYLNNQADFIGANGKKNDKYNKTPLKDEVGTTIHDDKDGKDFKDRVPFGTYVEVEAYYFSSNPGNPGEGTIKYRFMLGKDTSFDYDAQRNYHYKLTLGFNGWANDPDWHIDYVITTPAIEVPEVFRVSYLYMQKSELPIKIVGNIQWLTVTITENNWAPYDPNTTQPMTLAGKEYKIPEQTITSTPSTYQFEWNRAAFDNPAYKNPATPEFKEEMPYELVVGQERPQFGFLALHLPNRNTTSVNTSFSSDANKELIKYWANNLEGERRFANDKDGYSDFTIGNHDASWGDRKHSFPVDDNKYTVNSILNDNGVPLENQRILMLPVWTRTKTLINTSGFSGNNPYEAFERKAVVHIAGEFEIDGGKTQRIEKDVEVYQVKRITNPKGVWRSHERNEDFDVTLLEPVNSNAESDFQPFTSQGEWTAFIDRNTISDTGNTFSIRPNSGTNGYMRNDTVHGNTGSEIHFAITFKGKVEENESKCAVIKVLYHGNQCMHKILVRKGYNSPLRMGGTTPENGKLWSSFALYQATNTGRTEGGRQVFDAILTKNPLMLGSMFRRGRQDQGIFVWNNMQTYLATFVPPGNSQFVLGLKNDGVTITPGLKEDEWKAQWQTKTWGNIYRRDDRGTTNNLGIYYALDDEGNYTTDDNGNRLKYRVPTFDEFQALTENSEFGFGVFYGSEAFEPKLKALEAYGLIDPFNLGLFDDPNGMRAVVAYDKQTGNQILFPIGKYGIGVRRMYNVPNDTYYGNLHYSDVYNPLTESINPKNLYRPIPYNLSPVSGCIYWIDEYKASGYKYGEFIISEPCLGWDMNYFNFDFNNYTANNWADACPIKFVIDE